jgi:hypothetical protein
MSLMDYIKMRHLRGYLRAYKAPLNVILESRHDIKEFKNKYKGQRCFIIGNGPSLTVEDLNLIQNEYSFAANRIYKIFDNTCWRPTFYCIQDMNVAKELGEEANIALKAAKHCFIRMRSYDSTNKWLENHSNITYVPIVEKTNHVSKIGFAHNCENFIYDGWTVTYMSMQLAVYMGFSDIYLLGIDHSFPFEMKSDGSIKVVDTNKAAHFYETADSNKGDKGYERRTSFKSFVTKAYSEAEIYSKKTNRFRIYNATRGGELEVFERVELAEILDGRCLNREC